MPDRRREIDAFLQLHGWCDGSREAIAGDMSPRRYWRLTRHGRSAILMDADAPMTAFADMTKWLANLGLSAPEIYVADPLAGLILMEDFGNTSLKSALSDDPKLESTVFEDCLTLLLEIRQAAPPPLTKPDAIELVDWTVLADAHYPGADGNGLAGFREVLRDVLLSVLQTESVSLRDFHTENMMWVPQRKGHRRLGLLDYQDAFLTHPAYDLVSLLTDARTWIPRSLRSKIQDRYIERSGDDPDLFKRAFVALSAQRNLRILGIFSRAGMHLNCLPNTYRYFAEALEHPVFDRVRNETLRALPAPAEPR